MKWLSVLALLFIVGASKGQQKVIPLYNGAAPGSEKWDWEEKVSDSNAWNTKAVYNISHPTLTVFVPDASVATGTSVVICPGGGFYALSINSEGNDVAEWLVKKGITCFVLKYRLVHCLTNDPVKEFTDATGKAELTEKTKTVIPLAIADGKAAIAYVRQHSSEYNITSDHIGIIGFSEGGAVAGSAAYNYTPENRPAFVAPIYGYMPPELQGTIANDAPPMFIAAASDDSLGLALQSVDLYNKWLISKHPVELHMYVKGGHGFGTHTQNLPSDTWIDRFGDWLATQGLMKPLAVKWMSKLTPQQIEEYKRKRDEQLHNDWGNIKRYDEANKNLKTSDDKHVVFIGDSITDGWIEADSIFFARHPYIDRGISGQTTPQMLVRFRPDVVELKPAAVVILAGINDIAQNTGPMTLEQTFGNIASMAQLAKANNIRVVISSLLPAYDFADKVEKINPMLKDYANKNGFVYLDYFSAMADETMGLPKSLSRDGVHPNLAGYKLMEPLVEKAIAEALKHK